METDKISSMRNPPLEVMVERSNKERFNGARDDGGITARVKKKRARLFYGPTREEEKQSARANRASCDSSLITEL